MEAASPVVLRGEFGAAGRRAARYALTLTRSELHVQRLTAGPGDERRLVVPLRHVLECRPVKGPTAAAAGRPEGRPEEGRPEEGRPQEEGEDDQAAYFALYCYPPRKRRAVVGVSRGRQRLVKTFRVDGGGSRPENQATAERWTTAVRCLLLGVELPGEGEITPSLLPRPRRLLFFVNPHSGRSLAMSYCENHILPMILEANISYNLICTEYQNHARELVQEIKLDEWDGIVIVSGDGLLYEVINGLMERPDWEKAIQMPVGILPAGSGNALAAAVNHNAGYGMALGEELLVNCTLLLCRGLASPMDLVSVTTASGRRHFSFLSVAWGFVADVDIESEKYRGVGSARFSVGTLVCLASLRRYRGRLSYLPAGGRPKRALCRSITTQANSPAPAQLPPLGRASSETGLWRGAPADSPSPFAACEGFSFEGASLPPEGEEEDEVEGDHLPGGGAAGDRISRKGAGGAAGDWGSGGGTPLGDFASPSPSPCSSSPPPPPPLPQDGLVPPLGQPVPPHWETVEGDFVLVLAIYQTHLGADLLAAPFARFAEGALHLCYVRAGISRRALLRLFLAMGRGAHFSLGCPHLFCVPALAFRLEPLTPRGVMTVDGERVEYGPLQAQVHRGLAQLITGVPADTSNGL
ncbi:sphingosine kinase 2-like [Cetorhinus maximus]